ncbi:MAG: M20/M25/M40 family metallo-hydrolase [Reyranellaceae bacterium]
MSNAEVKQKLLRQVDEDRAILTRFLGEFVRARSPNPPGDTREAASCIMRFLDERGLAYRTIAPNLSMPNIVASFEGGAPGKHLVLNGHIDVFPLSREEDWTHDPWGGEIAGGRVYGVGCSDMKQGTASMVFAFAYLQPVREQLKGRLTLTAVSDEETFGPWGARYLMEHHPEVIGDCCLNAEPGAPTTIRIGEKAPLWITFTVETPGAHAAYTHKSESATKIAARLIADLEAVCDIPVVLPGPVARALAAGAAEIDRVHAPGAADIMGRVTLNIGMFDGGTLVNMLPGHCRVEADIRLPFGMTKEPVLARIREILEHYPQVKMDIVMDSARPAWSDPDHELVRYIRQNAKAIADIDALPITSLAGTDARLWRYAGVPAFSYGTTATNVAMPDEHTDIDEWIAVIKTHLASIFDYLTVDVVAATNT